MSSRWPQETEDVQQWQDSGWHDADGPGYAEQWGAAQGLGSARGSVAQAVAPRPAVRQQPGKPGARQTRNLGAANYQREWESSAGGSGDDADYDWIEYLTGAGSAQAKPADVPAQQRGKGERRQPRPKPDRPEKARRGGDRTERSRSRRQPKPAPPDTENGWPGHIDPGHGGPGRAL